MLFAVGKPRNNLEKMDSCNIPVTGFSASTFAPFQSIINTAAGEILLKLKLCHRGSLRTKDRAIKAT